MTRQEVIDRCRRAKTLPEVAAAFEVRGRWLAEHPEDAGVFDWGERLAMMQEGLELTGPGTTEDVPAATKAS